MDTMKRISLALLLFVGTAGFTVKGTVLSDQQICSAVKGTRETFIDASLACAEKALAAVRNVDLDDTWGVALNIHNFCMEKKGWACETTNETLSRLENELVDAEYKRAQRQTERSSDPKRLDK